MSRRRRGQALTDVQREVIRRLRAGALIEYYERREFGDGATYVLHGGAGRDRDLAPATVQRLAELGILRFRPDIQSYVAVDLSTWTDGHIRPARNGAGASGQGCGTLAGGREAMIGWPYSREDLNT